LGGKENDTEARGDKANPETLVKKKKRETKTKRDQD